MLPVFHNKLAINQNMENSAWVLMRVGIGGPVGNGPGIKDEVKLQLFRKSFKKTSSGLGIGLTIVKKILESYNGQIIIEDRIANNYTKGCNFILLIPEVV